MLRKGEKMETIWEIIYDCCEDFDPEEITEESRFMEDLEMSSLEFFSMMNEIEQEFGIKISERELQEFITVGDAIRVISEKAGL